MPWEKLLEVSHMFAKITNTLQNCLKDNTEPHPQSRTIRDWLKIRYTGSINGSKIQLRGVKR